MDLDNFDDDFDGPQLSDGEAAGDIDFLPPAKTLQALDGHWFTPATRRARWMDLLGDYAGTELFIISGESLLERVLDEPLLAIGRSADLSFQLLHAYYVLEQTLLEFINRRANFEIAFWQSSYHSTIHTGSSPHFIVSSRHLARSLLFQHLLTLDVPVHVFKDFDDLAWLQFQNARRPMFVMINDGGACDSGQRKDHFRPHRALLQRASLLKLINTGVAIALLNGAEFINSKIMSFVYHEAHRRHQIVLPQIITRSMEQAGAALDGAIAQFSPVPLQRLRAVLAADALQTRLKQFAQRIQLSAEFSSDLLLIFILHAVILPHLSLIERAQPIQPLDPALTTLLQKQFLPNAFLTASAFPFNIDGRVFVSLISTLLSNPEVPLVDVVGDAALAEAAAVWTALGALPLPDLGKFRARYAGSTKPLVPVAAASASESAYKLLPFNHPTVSSLLWPDIAVEDEDERSPDSRLSFSVPFSDTRHWHNSRSILPNISVAKDDWARMRLNRSNQRFMNVLQKNAATLTGALGASLQQIVIKPHQTVGKKKDKPVQLTSVQKAREKIKQEKTALRDDRSSKWWQDELDSMKSLSPSAQTEHLKALFRNKRSEEGMIGLEMRLYSLHLLFVQWIGMASPEREEGGTRDRFVLAMMKDVKAICERGGITSSAFKILESILVSLGFAAYSCPTSFEFKKLLKNKQPRYDFMAIQEDPVVWQLRLFGEFMDRSMDSAPDSRVSFKPDAWQREVLDCIDQKFSVLAIGSAYECGKTFILYYSMEKILRESDDGILVYIAPTKALVTQIATEVYARFKKNLTNKSLWAVHTRDYRINDPQKCQILVTVPEILATLLLSPPLARHHHGLKFTTIGQQDGGSVWEEIILMAPCPIIGLSATIGSPEDFSDWLGSVQRAHGFEYRAIIHPHRYSHLRKFYYDLNDDNVPAFRGLHLHEDSQRSRFLHPISLLSFGSRSFPEDLSLEAADTLSLYRAMAKHAANSDSADLEPQTFFGSQPKPELLVQRDVIHYETALKAKLSALLAVEGTVGAGAGAASSIIEDLQDAKLKARKGLDNQESPERFLKNLIFMLADLQSKNGLPAILFQLDRTGCEVMAKKILSTLQSAEAGWKKKSPAWQRKVKQWEEWQRRQKARERAAATAAKNRKREEGEAGEGQSGAAEGNQSWESSFSPDEPCGEFSFAGTAMYSKAELAEDKRALRWSNTPEWVLDALERGVGIHHAGMNKKYRSLVESLFRRGFIRVMIATGTLALGINAPAKTAVFCGDSPFLTALMYRQCAGRAGRRGFDLLGNVIFYGLPMERVQRLVLSKLPPLGGNFPLTSSLSLRLMNLLNGSNDAPVAVEAVQSLLRLPRISFTSDVGRDQVLHHMRFSIEYLRRSGLLLADGRPLDLFSLAAHLYYQEPNNFTLVALLKSGVLHKICDSPDAVSARKDLMLVLAHLFGRQYLSRVYGNDEHIRALAKNSPSMIMLPPLPKAVRQVLEDHDKRILGIFTGYARACAAQIDADADSRLPLSNLSFPEPTESTLFRTDLQSTAIHVIARSPFVANSGHTDTSFSSVDELARSARNGLHVNGNSIPSMKHLASPHGAHMLNAYILDFYIHGQVATLARANGIRRGDVWYLLQDFSLTLAVIELSLRQLLTAAGDDVDDAVGDDPAEVEDDEEDEEGSSGKDPMKRPPGVKESDWRLYSVVRDVKEEFDVKFKAMWA
ncbi:hypothetical protein FB45DRAFT_1128535 [Roridomyces roridus]|uniref:P-loop containing nucleoside triphosphate hydrolase protein n=1 Tax=Roridomyces roridus TaxID=1738132 RepID=A0AAD7B3A9_9AGAR|nr:hypothetical protein FB45DRAFT_1128535 [Roridomyces roridus]